MAGTLDITGSIDASSTGLFHLVGSAVLEIAAAGSGTQIAFAAGGAVVVDHAASFGINVGSTSYAGPMLDDFIKGDAIDLRDVAPGEVTGLSYSAATGVLQVESGGTNVASLLFQNASLGSERFTFSSDGSITAGTLIKLS